MAYKRGEQLAFYTLPYSVELVNFCPLVPEKMMKTIFSLSVILLVTQVSLSCKLESDGCSSPIKNIPFIKLFTPACLRHDICYRCVSI